MDKVDFFRLMGFHDHITMRIFDTWVDHREKNNLPWMIDDIDLNYEWTYDENGKSVIRIRTTVSDDVFPITDFYKEVDRSEEPQMLWHNGYWDGPLSGIARYKGKIVFFDCIEEEDFSRMRKFNLYEMSDEEIEDEIHRHNQWRRTGGRHCDYCDDFMDYPDSLLKKVKRKLETFYRWAKIYPRKDYTKNKVVGTFADVQFWKERGRRHDLPNLGEN